MNIPSVSESAANFGIEGTKCQTIRSNDKVECMIGPEQWGTGRIVRCLYREADWPPSKQSAPYQIKLDRKTADRVGIPPQYALIYSDWDDEIKVRKLPEGGMQYVD